MAKEELPGGLGSRPSFLGTKFIPTITQRFFIAGCSIVVICIFAGILSRFLSPKNISLAHTPDPDNQRLESFYKNKNEYDEAFASVSSSSAAPVKAYAVITSHHFLARSLIAKSLLSVDPAEIKNVLLISPDHFNALSSSSILAATTNANWDTPYGALDVDVGQIEAVTTLSQVQLTPKIFLNEHGIYTLIPFVKKQFPSAHITPLVLRGSDSFQPYEDFGRDLQQFYTPSQTLLIVSSDFTHNSSRETAQINDQKSIEVLADLSVEKISNVTSDCRVCLATLKGYLSNTPVSFQLIENKNSYDFSGQEPERVTSYVSGMFISRTQQSEQHSAGQVTASPPLTEISTPTRDKTEQSPETVNLLFGGDLMFDRTIRLKMKQFGNTHILKELADLFSTQTFVIANLEGPITSSASKSVGSIPGSTSNFIFTFDPSVAQMLFESNVRVVNLGNNHIRNFGENGVTETKEFLRGAAVQFFGDTGTEKTSAERTVILERNGLKIGLVNYNQFTTEGFEHTLSDIAFIRPNVDLVILYTHWGTEYVPEANEVIQSQAHRFIDEGVDLIIGSHPHVTQNVEEYKGKRIYYSLGNFVFDQYFSPETQKGMLVGVNIAPSTKQLTFTEYSVQLKPNGQTVLVETVKN